MLEGPYFLVLVVQFHDANSYSVKKNENILKQIRLERFQLKPAELWNRKSFDGMRA